MRRGSDAPGRRRHRPAAATARAQCNLHPDRQRGARQGLARWRHADRRARVSRSRPSPTAWTIRAGSTSCPTATCWWPRPTLRPKRARSRHQGLGQGLLMSRAGAKVPSANRITLLRDADGDGVAESKTVFLEDLNSPFGMDTGRQRPLRRQRRRDRALPLRARAQTQDHGARHQGRRPARRPDQPPLDQEHHRQQGRAQALRRPSARTAMSARTAWRMRKAAPRSGKSTRERPEAHLRLRPAQPQRHGLGARRPASCGRRSTSATKSAATWCPTT